MSKKIANKWTIETVSLADVKPFENNPRKIKGEAFNSLAKSIERFGYVDLIVWNKRTGNIVGGHQRYKILMEKGIKETKMIVVDMGEIEELSANITLNNPKIEGEWDDPITDLLGHLEDVDPEFFVDGNLDSLRDVIEGIIPENDTDTECPCCAHKWDITDKDVKIISDEELGDEK